MPFHGDHRRLRLHAQLAESVGIERERIFTGRNGQPLEIDAKRAEFGEETGSGMIFVDGVDIGDPDDVALRDRRTLSADGVFIVVATISSDDGSQVAPPEIIFRGVAVPRARRRRTTSSTSCATWWTGRSSRRPSTASASRTCGGEAP